MEAMSTGLPVISTNHSGIPELITNKHDGVLVEEKDIDAYTNALINLTALHDEIGIRARNKIIESFNFNTEMKKLTALYNHLIR